MLKMTAVVPGSKYLKNLKKIEKSYEDALKVEGDVIRGLYRQTYHNWEADHRPKEKVTLKKTNTRMYVEIKLEGRIYWFVHESISVMRAVLSPDWSPKTQPRVLASGAGSGAKVYASKKIAKPPYEAREFTEAIVEERQKPFEQRMRKATAEGAKALLGG